MESNPPPSNSHFLQWVIEILVPYLALLLGLALLRTWRRQQKFAPKADEPTNDRSARRYQDKLETAYDIGYEACILGFGMAVVMVGSSEFQAILKTEQAIVMPFVVAIPILALMLYLGTSGYSDFVKAIVGIIAGTLAFGIITAMVTWVREQQQVNLTVCLGALAWGVPCLAFIALIVMLRRHHASERG